MNVHDILCGPTFENKIEPALLQENGRPSMSPVVPPTSVMTHRILDSSKAPESVCFESHQ